MPNDPKKRTYAQLIAEAMAREAIKGKTQAASEIADRVEGKPRQAIEVSGDDGGPVEHCIRFISSNAKHGS